MFEVFQNKVKLLLTTYTGYPNANVGGPNKIINNIVNNLDYSKFEVGYFSKQFKHIYNVEGQTKYHENHLGIKTQFTGFLFNRFSPFRKILTSPIYLKYHYIKNDNYFIENLKYFNKFDIIHAHDILSFGSIKKIPLKKILTIHSKGKIIDDLKDYCNSKILADTYKRMEEKENDALEFAEIITFPSYSAKKLFLTSKGISDSKKYSVLYNGIDLKQIKQIDNYEGVLNKFNIDDNYDMYLLNIADHIKVKNISVLLEVINLLVNKYKLNPLFINIGKGPETNNLKKIIKNKNISGNVCFLQNINNVDIIRLLKKCDYFLMASERVVFDMVILEAMAAGIIIIASNQGGNKEIIQNEINGYLVNKMEPEEFARIIMADYNKEILNNAFETVKEFDNENIIKKYSTIYLSLLK